MNGLMYLIRFDSNGRETSVYGGYKKKKYKSMMKKRNKSVLSYD